MQQKLQMLIVNKGKNQTKRAPQKGTTKENTVYCTTLYKTELTKFTTEQIKKKTHSPNSTDLGTKQCGQNANIVIIKLHFLYWNTEMFTHLKYSTPVKLAKYFLTKTFKSSLHFSYIEKI